jgi:hypothetical protein
MENSKDRKIIDKIIKLMEKADSAKEIGSIAEAEAFAAKAQNLLAEYNLSKSDLTKEEAAAEIYHIEMPAKVPGIGGRSSFNIMAVIARFNWCKAYTYGKTSENKMIIVGSPENVEVCQYIHSTVLLAFIRLGNIEYKAYKEDFQPWMNPKTGKPVGFDTYMRTFLAGASDGLNAKLREEREAFMKANESSTAIVRTNEVVIQDYVVAKWGGAGKGKSQSYDFSSGAYGRGVEAGKNVKISKGINSSKPITRKMIG